MKEFEEVRGLFGEQVVDVYDKLVAIMRDTTLALVQGLKATSFVNPQAGGDSVNSYMESIVKKTLTIARSVQRYLPAEEYDGVLTRIFGEYEKILCGKYNEILEECASDKETTLKVKKQIWRDIKFFGEKLDDENAGDTVRKLLDFTGFGDQSPQTETLQEAKLDSDNITLPMNPEVETDVRLEVAPHNVTDKVPSISPHATPDPKAEKKLVDETKVLSDDISKVETQTVETDHKDEIRSQNPSVGPEAAAASSQVTNGTGNIVVDGAKENPNYDIQKNDSDATLKSDPKSSLKGDPENDADDSSKTNTAADAEADSKNDAEVDVSTDATGVVTDVAKDDVTDRRRCG